MVKDFAGLVAADVRQEATIEEADEIRRPENLEQFHDELVRLLAKTDAQLSRHKADRARKHEEYMKYLESSASWKASALSFRAAAFERLMEVKNLRRELKEVEDPEIEVITLRSAIKHHREAVVNAGNDTDTKTIDEELWSLLEEG